MSIQDEFLIGDAVWVVLQSKWFKGSIINKEAKTLTVRYEDEEGLAHDYCYQDIPPPRVRCLFHRSATYYDSANTLCEFSHLNVGEISKGLEIAYKEKKFHVVKVPVI